MLVNAGLTSFKKIEETNPREIELVGTKKNDFNLMSGAHALYLQLCRELATMRFVLSYFDEEL